MTRAALYVGDALEVLRTLPDESVQCCVTSPPYWGLRDYGTGRWEGGAGECDHTRGNPREDHSHGEYLGTRDRQAASVANASPQLQTCQRCGALRVDQQLGLEDSPDEYIERMVEVFEEIRRVLRLDGVLWLNMGDSYANDGKWGGSTGGIHPKSLHGDSGIGRRRRSTGLKPKDLVMMPARLALALQAAGWWIRMDTIWHKPTSMPESVKDRPTRAHEYIYLLSKSARYFYDADSIKEPVTGNAHARGNGVNPKAKTPSGWDTREGNHREKTGRYPRPKQNESFSAAVSGLVDMRNARSVWTIQARPYPSAHFATFPPELAERCIKAGTRPGDTVLDPFGGSGTTAAVATGLGRKAIHIDLNPEYLDLAIDRIGPMLVDVKEVVA